MGAQPHPDELGLWAIQKLGNGGGRLCECERDCASARQVRGREPAAIALAG